ncbi:microtubule-associated protein Jupiter isoform X2 [Belonocnema kinseyi]|uniref:microtubule-associated protein Jupiter isoform X2 n=1 Tax=Belonocnema kinseyi TaxID=2817044 RepID=UPI00143D0928|nr:microtubule-associated protein Jupiter isoform X2 [Belonocnema kinseyi]
MTSTGIFSGLKDDRKSSKVLKPPGGGSSDIFGAGPEETSPRRIKSHNQSQLGSSFFSETTSNDPSSNGPETPRVTSKPGNDSYKRLFGPPDAPSTQNLKNHMRSNIPLNEESTAVISPAKSTSSSNGSISSSSISNGNSHSNDNTDGNPVTGTGYAADQQNNAMPVQNESGNANSSGSEKSTDISPGTGSMSNKVQRNRVPPGGYSSGLW